MLLQGHAKPILALDWAPDGFTLATGGEDNSVRIWDLRMRRCTYVIPAHQNLVTGVKFWDCGAGWDQVPAVNGVEDADMSPEKDTPFANAGVSSDLLQPPAVPNEAELKRLKTVNGTFLVTSSYDGTAKMWTAGDWKPVRIFAGHDGKVVGVDVSSGWFAMSGNLDAR